MIARSPAPRPAHHLAGQLASQDGEGSWAFASRLLEDRCATRELPRRAFTDAALALLAALTWPGNLAELRDVVDHVAADGSDGLIQIENLLPVLRLDRAPAPFKPAGELR